MKRFYFLLICALISVQTFAQDKWADIWCDTWNVLDFDGMRFEETVITRTFRLKQDTIIGNQTYRQFSNRVSVRFSEDKKVYVHYKGFDDDNPYTPDLPTGEYLAYDFSAQVGDTLEVFSGLDTYSTYPCVVDSVDIDPKTKLRTITLHQICRIDDGGIIEEFDDMQITWIEGVGSPVGFLFSYLPCGWVGGPSYQLLCAHKGDELRYASRLYDSYGCEYNSAAQKWADTWCDTWNVMGFDGMIFDQSAETNQYKLAQDTIIGDYKYTMLTRRRTNSPISTLEYVAAVRFTGDKKVYAHIENTELLVYDFNAQVGDTLEVFPGIDFPIETYKCVVYNVEKNLETNQNTIHLYPLDIEGNIIEIEFVGPWIEGVGSETGFLVGLSPDRASSWNFSLLCAYKGDELKYTGIFYDDYDCEYNATTAVEDIPTPKISSKKFLQDDQLLILHDGKIYNVMGVEVGQ